MLRANKKINQVHISFFLWNINELVRRLISRLGDLQLFFCWLQMFLHKLFILCVFRFSFWSSLSQQRSGLVAEFGFRCFEHPIFRILCQFFPQSSLSLLCIYYAHMNEKVTKIKRKKKRNTCIMIIKTKIFHI